MYVLAEVVASFPYVPCLVMTGQGIQSLLIIYDGDLQWASTEHCLCSKDLWAKDRPHQNCLLLLPGCNYALLGPWSGHPSSFRTSRRSKEQGNFYFGCNIGWELSSQLLLPPSLGQRRLPALVWPVPFPLLAFSSKQFKAFPFKLYLCNVPFQIIPLQVIHSHICSLLVCTWSDLINPNLFK